jgi:selenocysteine-specific elongation factor
MLVIGTAGHIDHGKTSLVHLLTGRQLDTLPEEKDRGITIALGFAPLDLPDGRRAALVDVPGHERLVRTMVAGATGLDAVLLVVSAVDGVMPQTREHLAILTLLGVERGLVAVSMADLVDAELLELAVADVEDVVAGTFLEGAPIVPTSVPDRRGRDEVLARLAELPEPEPDPTGPFRLPVDRAFSRPGFGTVATGTSWSGTLRDGETVRLAPTDRTARVRGIQVQGEKADEAPARARVAVNLAGVETTDVPRGTVVVKGAVPDASMVDAVYHHLADTPPLDDGSPVRVLLGTAEVMGRMYLAVADDAFRPGARVPVQLRLESPLSCLHGDRFIVRRSSPMETLGGGTVVDPYTRRMRTRDRVRMGQETLRLAAGDTTVWLVRAGDVGLDAASWRERGGEGGLVLGGRHFAAPVVARLQGLLLDALQAFHEANPLALGAHRRELHRDKLGHLDGKVFDELVESLSQTAALRFDGPLVRIAAFAVQLDDAQRALSAELLEALQDAGPGGMAPATLHTAFPQPEVAALLRLLENDGAVEQVAGIGWVTTDQREALRERVRDWFAAHETLSPGDFKELSGLTRKTAIPWLEYLDKRRDTAFGPSGRRTRGSQL